MPLAAGAASPIKLAATDEAPVSRGNSNIGPRDRYAGAELRDAAAYEARGPFEKKVATPRNDPPEPRDPAIRPRD